MGALSMDDTIAAISTPIGQGGIAVVRLSGPQSLTVADRVFYCSDGRPSEFPTHTVHYGTIGQAASLLDSVLLTVMLAPRTYTKEDVVEISCHGGSLVARSVLARCLECGARLAEPGEFTKRAFLNGRLDLTQAEAVMDLIQARTGLAQNTALQALQGHLHRRVEGLRDRLLTVLANLEANIDFPEEDILPQARDQLALEVQSIIHSLQRLLATAHDGRILREGMVVAIVGLPNVGKSSLMNALLGRDRCIVTPIPGTTRDVVEEVASIYGIPVRLTDTAGLRTARGEIENMGIRKSYSALQASDLVLHVMDRSRPFTKRDAQLTAKYHALPAIQVLNKCDLPERLTFPAKFSHRETVVVSATSGVGLEKLRSVIEKMAWSNGEQISELGAIVNERHADAIRRALLGLIDGTAALKDSSGLEMVAQSLRCGLTALGEITGRTTSEDVLNRVFSRFCIGK